MNPEQHYHVLVHADRKAIYPPWKLEAEVETSCLKSLGDYTQPRHVYLRRILMKLIRDWWHPKLDNLVDIVGYTVCENNRSKQPPAICTTNKYALMKALKRLGPLNPRRKHLLPISEHLCSQWFTPCKSQFIELANTLATTFPDDYKP